MLFFFFSAFAAPQTSVLYKVDDKVGVWMENQSGNSIYSPETLYQTKEGYATRINQGFMHKHYLGGYFYTTSLSEDATPYTEFVKNATPAPKGYRIEEKQRARGSVFYLHKKDGSKSLIARGTKKIDSTLWFTMPSPTVRTGFTKPTDVMGWKKTNSKYTYTLPDNANVLSVKDASQDEISAWNKEVKRFLPHVSITHGKWANLDTDPEPEAIICGSGVRFDSCFVYDKEEDKWFATLLKWNNQDTPLVFEKNGGTYILFRSHKKSRLLRVLYFTGYEYDTHLLRNKSSRRKK